MRFITCKNPAKTNTLSRLRFADKSIYVARSQFIHCLQSNDTLEANDRVDVSKDLPSITRKNEEFLALESVGDCKSRHLHVVKYGLLFRILREIRAEV